VQVVPLQLLVVPRLQAAIKAMAEAHPYAAKLVKAAIKAGVGAEAYKHRGWLLDLLP
jgi:hypothetical protein